MLSSAWSFDRKDFPDNIFKAWIRLEVEDKNFSNYVAINAAVSHISHPEFPFHSRLSPPDDRIELTRKEGPNDTWQLKFHYQFHRNPEETKFRGKFSLRTMRFGTWEPFYYTKFLYGNVLKAKNEAGTQMYSCNILETLKTTLSSHFVPTGRSTQKTRIMEAQLLLEFCDFSLISEIEMKAAYTRDNYLCANNKTDCTIQVNKTKFYCHSEKIKSMSNVWERLFELKENDSEGSRITLDWSQYFTNHRPMQIFLRFVYYSEMPPTLQSLSDLFEILKFAHMFNITTLERASKTLIVESPDIETVPATLGFEMYSFSKKVDSLGKLNNITRVMLKRNASRYKKAELLKLAKEDTESFVEVFQCEESDSSDSDEPSRKKNKTDRESSDN